MPSINAKPSKEGYCIHIESDDNIYPLQPKISVDLKVVFPDNKFILSILYGTNINRFFKNTNLFGMSLNKIIQPQYHKNNEIG